METMMAWDTLAERVSGGEALTEADAATILAAPDLIAIGVLGDGVRRRLHGSRTTFVRVFELHVGAPPTALRGRCGSWRSARAGGWQRSMPRRPPATG